MQIAKVFKEHNVSLSEVARRMGISKGTLSDAIRRDNMHTDTLRRIAKAAGCNVSEFLPTRTSRMRKGRQWLKNPISRLW